MKLKDFLFPLICSSFLNEAKDPNVIVVNVNIGGEDKKLLKVWLDSSKKNLMISVVDGKDFVKYKKDIHGLMSALISGRFFRDSFIKKYFEKNNIEVVKIENLSKGGVDIYGLPFSYFRIKLLNSDHLERQNILNMLLEFKRFWNSTNSNIKILDIN